MTGSTTNARFWFTLTAVLMLSLPCSLAAADGQMTGADGTYGFRANGQGRFPDATPVTEWGVDKNILWKTPLPSWSNASPVICGDRIYVCSEPTTVVCVNRADGRMLWQQSNDYLDLLTDPAEKKKAEEQTKKDYETKKRLDAAMTDKKKSLGEARERLKKSPGDAELKKQEAGLAVEIGNLQQEINECRFVLPPTYGGVNGYSSATPVTDGEKVWAVFGTGTVVCYRKDGSLLWGRKLENPPHVWGSSSSPVLAGKVLLVQYNHLFGLDAETGKEIWKCPVPWGWGTPVVAKIGDRHVVYTCQGSGVTTSDGKEVAKGLGELWRNSPLLQDGMLYYINKTPSAFRLPTTPMEEPVRLWSGDKLRNEPYSSSPLLHEGLIYIVNELAAFTVLDATNGKKVYDKSLKDYLKGCVYSSVTLAGKNILLSSEDGRTIVLSPGREYVEIARNQLEPFRSSPVFAGDQMFIRTLKSLYCIGK